MRILADENCEGPIVEALSAAGHVVNWIARSHPGANDLFIFALAIEEARVLLSQDQDFSQILMKSIAVPPAVAMMRFGRYPKASRP